MTYEFIPLLPLVSFLILGLFGHWIKDNAHLVAVPAVVVSWLLSVLVFFDVAGVTRRASPHGHFHIWPRYSHCSPSITLPSCCSSSHREFTRPHLYHRIHAW
jgi:hypothetical protein